MDKNRFVVIAPIYYALAIARNIGDWDESISEGDILASYTEVGDGRGATYCYLRHSILFKLAAKWLSEKRIIEVFEDPFAPSIYIASDDWENVFEELATQKDLPFFRYSIVSDKDGWLNQALVKLNETYDKLGIQKEDFDNPDVEWQPLPLDRTDPQLRTTIIAIDDVIEQVRADNGYNATYPEERNYVLDGLKNVSQALKEKEATSVPYIRKYAIEPLNTLLHRFKDGIIQIVAAVAKGALIELLKTLGVTFLEKLF